MSEYTTHPRFRNYVIPASDRDLKIGAATDSDIDQRDYACVICRVDADRHDRYDEIAMAQKIAYALSNIDRITALETGYAEAIAEMKGRLEFDDEYYDHHRKILAGREK